MNRENNFSLTVSTLFPPMRFSRRFTAAHCVSLSGGQSASSGDSASSYETLMVKCESEGVMPPTSEYAPTLFAPRSELER